MRRWETFAALFTVMLASLSVVPLGGHSRPALALGAIALLLVIILVRLRTVREGKKSKPKLDAYERALRIQEARERKYWR